MNLNRLNFWKTNPSLAAKAALVSQFQNAVAAVIGQKQAKVDGLRNMGSATFVL